MKSLLSNVEEVLKFAIHKEESAKRFYRQLAEKIENPEGARVFADLANDEQVHRERLEGIWRQKFGKPFPLDESKIDKRKQKLNDKSGAVEALDLAIKSEQEAAEAYERVAQSSQDKQLTALCLELAKEEWGHYQTLNAEKNAVIDSFYWFDVDHIAYVED